MSNVGDLIRALASEPWAMEPAKLEGLFAQLAMIHTWDQARLNERGSDGPELFEVVDGVAQIPIVGTIVKKAPRWWAWYDISATSTASIRTQIERAAADPRIKSIRLLIDSPGGSVAGTQEAADAIAKVRGVKPVHAHVEDLAASGAYWLASQADTISANRTASIGSIGVYMTLVDSSQFANRMGFKVHVLRSGDQKGVGEPGAPISDEQLKVEQERIDSLARVFADAVARGRGRSSEDMSTLATGRTWLAEQAKDLGLIDSVRGEVPGAVPVNSSREPAKVEVITMTEVKAAAPVEDKSAQFEARISALESENAKVRKDLETEKAKSAEASDKLNAARKELREGLIEKAQADGRVTGPMLAGVKSIGDMCGEDLAKFREILAGYPVQVKAEPAGAVTPDKPRDALEVRREKAGNIDTINADGTVTLKDGTRIKRADALK